MHARMIVSTQHRRTTTTLALLGAMTLSGCGFLPVPDQKDPVSYYARKDAEEIAIQNRRGPATQPVARAAGGLGDLFRLLGDYMNDTTPIQLVNRMEDMTSADSRWWAINMLASRWFAHYPPYTTRFGEKAVGISSAGVPADPDYVVRAYAVRALNRSRDASQPQVFIKALSDKSELVRLEAAKALNNLPNPDAATPLLARLNDANETMDVRIAAAEALRHYRNLGVARGLVGVLDNRDFGIAWQARRSLHAMTKTDHQLDQARWLNHLTGSENPFG